MSFGVNDITGAVSGFTGIYVWDAQGRLKVIGGGTPPPPAPVVWGTITGLVTNQTDLITYLGLNYYPLSSNPAGYLTQTAADLLYYPLSSNPAGYITLTSLSAGTGISYNSLTGVITNSAPDQTVVLTAGSGISITGAYPSFTIDNTGLVSVPDLQHVTNVGATTTNTIYVDAGAGTSTTIADYQIDVADSANRVRIGTDYVAIRSNGVYDAVFASTNLTAGILTLEVPNKTGTYTIATTDQLGLQNAITIDPLLTTDNIINSGNFSLQFSNNYKFEVDAEERVRFQADNGTDSANMYASPIDNSTYLDYIKGGTQQTFISLLGDELRIGTPLVSTKSVGDVLTLSNPLTGEVEFQTPTGGSGGLVYGLATQSPAGVYTSTIAGVTALTAGDVFMIKFDTVNDGASTLNINALGAVNIYKNTSTPLSSGDIKANQTVEVVYDGTNFQAIGLVTDQLLAYVHNAEGATISKGQVVYAYQASGNKMSVKLAKADSDATSAKTVGLVYDASIGIGGEGYIIIQGVIEGIDTSAFTAGNTLYLSGTTYGATTNVKPYAPIHLVYVGIVERANAGNGQIYVRCQNGYELDEIHDVDLITVPPVNNDVLVFDTSTTPDLWVAKSVPTILGMNTVGQNLVSLANPSAISYIRINADNSVTALTTSQLKSDLGLSRTVLSSDVSTTAVGTTLEDVTGLTFPIVAGNRYKFTASLIHTASPVNVGLRYAINADVAVSSIQYRILQNGSVVTALYIHHANALNSASTNSGGTVTNTISTIEGMLVASNTGTVIVRFSKSQANAGTLTIKAGSFIEYQII